MKCERCGNYEATCHYTSNINGKITESHLCPECAGESDFGRGFFEETERMLGGVMRDFGDFFSAPSLMPSFGFSPFFSLPSFASPRAALGLRERPAQTEKRGCSCTSCGCAETKQEKKCAEADPELSRRREINELREQMRAFAEAEEFEKAAEIRDKLRELEK